MDEIKKILISKCAKDLCWNEIKVGPEQPPEDTLHDLFILFSAQRQRVDVADFVLQGRDLRLDILLLRIILGLSSVVEGIPNITCPTVLSVIRRFNRG